MADFSSSHVTQLYEHLELFSEGDPPRHSLFVLGRLLGTPDELLIIDPPADLTQRFTLADRNAVLFTRPTLEVTGVPQLQTRPGGLAHSRIGQHLLDIYTQVQRNVVHLPAVGVICGGDFGSDLALPRLADGSDGSEETETLRLLARLVKQQTLQLYIPREGSLSRDKVEIMGRLANDVAYVRGLREQVRAGLAAGESLTQIHERTKSSLPSARRTPHCRAMHSDNVITLVQALGAA